MPYKKFQKLLFADDIIEFIAEMAGNYLKLEAADHKDLGHFERDASRFLALIRKEGVIDIQDAYDEL